MKRLLLSSIIIVLFQFSKAATITWDGAGLDGLWSTAANWVGDVVPGSADEVILDNSSLSGNYTVTLPGIAVTIVSLKISPIAGNTIRLLLPSSNTITADAFVTTGTLYTVIIDNGGIFENNAGVTSGTNFTIADSFRINDGGQYIHKTRSGHAGWLSKLSRATGTENGIFEFDIPVSSTTISLSGRTYGTLKLSAVSNGGTVTYIGSGGSPLHINGDLQINTGVTFSISMTADVIVRGDYDQATGSTFNIQSSSGNNVIQLMGNIAIAGTLTEGGAGLPEVQLNGTTNQSITVTGSITNTINFNVNNTAGISLSSPLVLPNNLILTNGKVTTTSINLLTIKDDAVCTGGSASSFINGPMKKIGDDNFIFPVGVGSIYAPIGIFNVSGETVSDEFTAEYKRTSPQSIHGPTVQAGQDHVSYVEYWKLDQNNGPAIKKISLAVNTTSFCKALNNTYVSRWNGSVWTSEGSTNGGVTTVPPYETGTITSVSDLSAFGDFTLITDLSGLANPLPVDLIVFDVSKTGKDVLIRWELTDYCSASTTFEVQHSTDGRNFTGVVTIPGMVANKLYRVMDTARSSGNNYYRLKIKEENGRVSYSRIAAITMNSANLLVTSFGPDPVISHGTITLVSDRHCHAQLFVYDMTGKMVRQWQTGIDKGANPIRINFADLAPGIYQLLIVTGGERETVRFIKQR